MVGIYLFEGEDVFYKHWLLDNHQPHGSRWHRRPRKLKWLRHYEPRIREVNDAWDAYENNALSVYDTELLNWLHHYVDIGVFTGFQLHRDAVIVRHPWKYRHSSGAELEGEMYRLIRRIESKIKEITAPERSTWDLSKLRA
jgi:hypothetical protein